jgi:hypothetical protein
MQTNARKIGTMLGRGQWRSRRLKSQPIGWPGYCVSDLRGISDQLTSDTHPTIARQLDVNGAGHYGKSFEAKYGLYQKDDVVGREC